jgi:hypothetical protein
MAFELRPQTTQLDTDQILTKGIRTFGTIRNPHSLPSEASAKEGAIRNRSA